MQVPKDTSKFVNRFSAFEAMPGKSSIESKHFKSCIYNNSYMSMVIRDARNSEYSIEQSLINVDAKREYWITIT